MLHLQILVMDDIKEERGGKDKNKSHAYATGKMVKLFSEKRNARDVWVRGRQDSSSECVEFWMSLWHPSG